MADGILRGREANLANRTHTRVSINAGGIFFFFLEVWAYTLVMGTPMIPVGGLGRWTWWVDLVVDLVGGPAEWTAEWSAGGIRCGALRCGVLK